jgi:hypothetical protein
MSRGGVQANALRVVGPIRPGLLLGRDRISCLIVTRRKTVPTEGLRQPHGQRPHTIPTSAYSDA